MRMYEAMSGYDVTDLLASIETPTMVIRHTGVTVLSMEMAKHLASAIPNARLVVAEGKFGERDDELGGAIVEFLSEGEVREEQATLLPSGTAVILFADIADSTALTERLGDTAFREKARDLDASLRQIIRECGGRPVEGKLLGDGVLAVFTSARQAIEAALACGKAGDDADLPLHLGIHAGDVIREEGNVYGGAVNVAARIADASAPGEVLVSQTVRDLARTSARVSFEERGRRKLKGVEGQQRLFAVRGGADG